MIFVCAWPEFQCDVIDCKLTVRYCEVIVWMVYKVNGKWMVSEGILACLCAVCQYRFKCELSNTTMCDNIWGKMLFLYHLWTKVIYAKIYWHFLCFCVLWASYAHYVCSATDDTLIYQYVLSIDVRVLVFFMSHIIRIMSVKFCKYTQEDIILMLCYHDL